MSGIRKDTIRFKSADEQNEVAGYYYTCEGVKPHCILQISHGMCEYIGRYDDFAEFMARHGYVVCGNDHLGHGATSDGVSGVNGYFGAKNGRKFVLQDLHRMNTLASKAYPGLPIILLGHSMGSFFARLYAATYPETIAGLILSGTGGPNRLGGVGLALTSFITKIKGAQYRSKFINNLAFGTYLKQVEGVRTPYDWISRDTAVVDKYAADEKCTYLFTVSAMHELMKTLQAVSTPEWAARLNKEMPVLLVSGDKDPVGDYGKGVQTVYGFLKDAGIHEVSLKLYEGARHEVLNETNRSDVYADILAWCDTHFTNEPQA